MDDSTLTSRERELVGRCLKEAADGSYFEEWEFETLMGAPRQAVRTIGLHWMSGKSVDSEAMLLTLNVFNNLTGYPHHGQTALKAALDLDPAGIDELHAKLKVIA